ncbi:hypothetical protein BDC45DRAFT_92735 [Circinella umbellata]|nr:hypothetical protein BDC45DRAFT_92735 [Circinella umbellata]
MSYKNCVPKNFKHCTFQFDIDGTGKFFSNRLLSQWFYQNYKSQFPKNAIEKTILQSYTNDLALLRKQDLPREVVSFIKQLSKNVKKELSESPSTSSSAGTPTYTVYNPNNCNVGSHGTIIIDSKQERDLTREQGRSPKKREQVVPITRVTSEQQQQRHRSPVNKGADDDDDNDEEEQQQSSIDAIDRFFSRNENDQTCHDGDDCITLPGPAAVLSKDIDIGSEPEYGPDDGFEEEHEQRRQPNEDRRLPNENDDDETLQAGRDNTTTVTSNKFRSLIFEKGYKLFKGHLDLYDILEINTAKQNVQPSTLGEYLDHFSHHLIGLKQTTPINETLK